MDPMPGGRKWRRRVGIIRTPPWNRIGPYFPDRVLDGGRDAPLGRRGRAVWWTLLTAVVVLGVAVVAVSR
jgi:hypothetical protein